MGMACPPTGNRGSGGSLRQLSDPLLRRYPQTQARAGTGQAGGRPGNSSACPTLGTGRAGAKVTLSVGAEPPGPGVFLRVPLARAGGPNSFGRGGLSPRCSPLVHITQPRPIKAPLTLTLNSTPRGIAERMAGEDATDGWGVPGPDCLRLYSVPLLAGSHGRAWPTVVQSSPHGSASRADRLPPTGGHQAPTVTQTLT